MESTHIHNTESEVDQRDLDDEVGAVSDPLLGGPNDTAPAHEAAKGKVSNARLLLYSGPTLLLWYVS
jgi:hypothetical protein